MFAKRRNQVIITALVIMIAVAGYLNYIESSKIPKDDGGLVYSEMQDAGNGGLIDTTSGQELVIVNSTGSDKIADPVSGEVGIASSYDDVVTIKDVTDDVIQGEEQAENDKSNSSNDAGTAVFVNNSDDSSFFIQAKLDREQHRAMQKETLKDLINNQNVAKEKREECATSMLEIQERIEKESAAEALIEAKGFAEAFVRIDDNTVDVIVSKSVLTDAEIAQIEDIVKRKTGIDVENIRVAPYKVN